jgi:bla regulator protein blaR1
VKEVLRAFPGFVCLSLALAQSPGSPLAFEVASVKPSNPDPNGFSIQTIPGEGLRATNVPLKTLITYAYDIRDYQLSGDPRWIGEERYDISARTARGNTAFGEAGPRTLNDSQRKIYEDRIRERVRTLLAERFGLMIHHASQEQTVYFLTVAKGGPKMKSVVPEPGARQGMSGSGRGHTQAYAVTSEMTAAYLARVTGRIVVDKTGLDDKYDWTLDWAPDAPTANDDGAGAPPAGPTIFTAVQEQLGLRLESGKAPVDKIVIDRVNRPTEN